MSRNKIAAATITAAALGLGIVGYIQITRANDSDEAPLARGDDLSAMHRGYLANHQTGHGGAVFHWPGDAVQARSAPAAETGEGFSAPAPGAEQTASAGDSTSDDARPFILGGQGHGGSMPFVASNHSTGDAFSNGGGFSGLSGGSFGGGASRGGSNGGPADAHDGPPPADHHHDNPPADSGTKDDNHTGPGTEYPPDNGGHDGWYGDSPGDDPTKDVHSVPEPTTIGLFALGGLAAAAFRRRRKN